MSNRRIKSLRGRLRYDPYTLYPGNGHRDIYTSWETLYCTVQVDLFDLPKGAVVQIITTYELEVRRSQTCRAYLVPSWRQDYRATFKLQKWGRLKIKIITKKHTHEAHYRIDDEQDRPIREYRSKLEIETQETMNLCDQDEHPSNPRPKAIAVYPRGSLWSEDQAGELETRPTTPARAYQVRPSGPQIDQAELEAFRATLPEYRRHESYRFLAWSWDIVKALYLIHKYPRQLGRLNVAESARSLGLDKPIVGPEETQDGKLAMTDSLVVVDPKFAMSDQVDEERPVLLALLQLPGQDQAKSIFIDGLHRLYRAAQQQKISIPCYVLTPQEERLCRL